MRSKRVELILDTIKAQRGARDLSKEVGGLADNMTEADRAGTAAGRAIDAVGDEMSEAARAAAALDRQIDELAGSLKQLAIAEVLTGESFSKQLREQEAALKKATRNRKMFGDLGAEAAPEFALSFSQRLGPLLANMPIGTPLTGALVGAGVAAAPLLAAAVSGAIIGGVGIGGVIGGLSIAAKDTRVKAAGDAVGDRLEARLNRAAGAFVKPAIEGLNQVQRTIDQIDLEGIFGNTAKLVEPLAAGVSSAVKSIGEALTVLSANAGGPVRAIADGIALIGQKASQGLKSLADNGQEGAAALKTLFGVVASGVTVTFTLVNALTELYGIGQKFGADAGLQLFLKATGAEMERVNDAARKTGSGTFGMSQEMVAAAASAEVLKEKQKALKAVQDTVTTANNALTTTLDRLGGQNTVAARTSAALSTAMDNLYGATMRQADANVAYEASWDSLSGAVKGNKKSLDIHTEAGRTNREALVGLITSTNQAYLADINAGVAIDKARQKHNNRIESIERESVKLGLNRGKTQDLIKTYGQIPDDKTTNLVLDGVREVVRALQNLYIYQRALAEGRSIASIEQKMRTGSDSGPAKRGGGYAQGGYTGPGPKYQVAGEVHAGEYVFSKEATSKIGVSNLDEMHEHARRPGYAQGGLVAPVDSSRRWPFIADVSDSYIMSRAAAAAKVTPAGPKGVTGPWMERLLESRFGVSMISGYRPGSRTLSGNLSYHSQNRAVDFPPLKAMAQFMYENYKPRLKEAITPYQQYNVHNGRDRRWTGAVWNQHNFAGGNAHNHFAMANGGMIREPVFGVGRSGATYSLGEGYRPERVVPMGRGGGFGGGVNVTVQAGYVVSERQLEDKITATVDTLMRKGRI